MKSNSFLWVICLFWKNKILKKIIRKWFVFIHLDKYEQSNVSFLSCCRQIGQPLLHPPFC